MSRLDALANKLKLPPAMLLFLLAIVSMTLLSAVYSLTTTYVLRLSYPYSLPLFFFDDYWFDFTVYHDQFLNFRTPAFWAAYDYPFTYPAPLALVYAVLYLIPHALRYFLVGYAAVAVAAMLRMRRALVERGLAGPTAVAFTLLFFALNYPLRTLFNTANTEGLVVLLAACGTWLILRDRGWLGGSLVAIAGTMKIFPFILLALLLSKRRYREFAFSLCVASVVNYTSLVIIGPTIGEAQRHIADGIRYVQVTFIDSANPATLTFNHSLFTAVKFAVAAIHRTLHPLVIHNHADWLIRDAAERSLLGTTFTVYVIVAATFGLVVYFAWIRRLPMLNQLLALTSCALFLPPLSADYTLLHMVFPFALLCLYAVDRWQRSIDVPGLKASFLCFAPIFSFQTYLTWRYRFSCEFRTLGLIALLVIALRYRFTWSEVDETEPPHAPYLAAASR